MVDSMLFFRAFSSSVAMVISAPASAAMARRRSRCSGRLKLSPRLYMSSPLLPMAGSRCMYSRERLKSG